MTAPVEYAEMAGDSYISNYGLVNRFPVPVGWAETQYSSKPSGFEAISLQNAANPNEIVISFAGTDFTSLPDWTQANIPLAFGYDAAQLKDAADYYLSVQALNPNATISFTGHSLGGGLAALMAVMFNKTAVTFDQAPFANAATASVANNLLSYLQGENIYTAAQLQPLNNFISESSATPGVIPNADNVTDTNVQGEALSLLPFSRIGTQTNIAQQNDMSIWSLPSLALHSQALLTAFLQSDATSNPNQTLNEATFQITDLEKMIFDNQLYAYSPSKNIEDFLQKIIDHQNGSVATVDPVTNQQQAALPADQMVTRFTDDLWKIAQPGGLTMSNTNLTDALVAFAMDKYYNEKTGAADAGLELYNQITGGISFGMANVPQTDSQDNGNGYAYGINHFNQYVSSTYDNASYNANTVALINQNDSGLSDWYIQAGTSGMDATDTHNTGALMLGGAGSDILTGGFGNNLLVAGAGNDTLNGGTGISTLIGGAGSDFLYGGQGDSTLYGGSGNDTFIYTAPATGTTTETIIEGIGTVNGSVFDGGTQITGNGVNQQTDGTWVDSNGYHYQFVADGSANIGTMTISGLSGANSGDNIVIDNFDINAAQTNANGYLGIKFSDQLAVAASANAADDPFTNGGTYTAATQAASVATGNVQTVTVYASAISATDQTVSLSGGGSSLFISTGADLLAFNGTLNLVIPAGQDHVTFGLVDAGNASQSVNLSATLTNADGTVSSNALTVAFGNPNPNGVTTPPSVTPDHTIVGDLTPVNFNNTGSGGPEYQYDALGNIITSSVADPNFNDTLFGSATGNDLIEAGGGNNVVSAGNGNTTITGGDGNDSITAGNGNNIITDGSGNDTILAGAGSNTITGGQGQDSITAGSGNNVINGTNGQDVIIADNGNNQIYANQQTDLADALTQAKTTIASGTKGSFMAVGSGNNTLVGGAGNDVFVLGGGNDMVILGPGNDTVEGGQVAGGVGAGWSTTNSVQVMSSSTQYSVNYKDASLSSSGGYTGSASYPETSIDSSGTPVGMGNETILGGAGNDFIIGSNGNNYIDVGSGNSTVFSGAGNDTIFAGTGNSTITGQAGNDYIVGETGNDEIQGGAGNNTIFGGSGNDTIAAGEGSDPNLNLGNNYVDGGSGNSILYGSGGNDTLIGGTGNATIFGGGGNQSLVGGSGNVLIYGGMGNDTIDAGGNGNDTLYAGDGATTVYGGGGTDSLVGGAGIDLMFAGDGGTAAAPTELQAGNGASSLYGGAGVDNITGGSGTDTLYAGSGISTLQGGTGTEVMYGGGGNDTLIAGSGSDTLYGASGTEVLQGSSGNTQFVAGSGNETILGGSGVNVYQFNDGFGSVELNNVQAADTVQFGAGISLADLSMTATLDSHGAPALLIQTSGGGLLTIDGLTIDGEFAGAINQFAFADGTTLSLAQLMVQGQTTPITTTGANGNLIFSANGGDTLTGGAGNDTIDAWNSNNTLIAGSGNQTLISASGSDTLIGGTGNDTFVINSLTDLIDAQSTGSNINTVQSSVDYVAPANVQNLTLIGTADLSATGNSLNNTLTANSGNDTLNAGTGLATMVGGSGSDTFIVNNVNDVIQAQTAGSNTNAVLSSVNYVAPANVEDLTLTGNANLSATGNNLNDMLTANNGNDTLIAGSGVVTMTGGTGNDTFVVNNTADVIQAQSSGININTVFSSASYVAPTNVQDVTLTGYANLSATGSNLNSIITANNGNDTLYGSSGNGTLVGGSGLDTFVLGGGASSYTAVRQASSNAIMQLGEGLSFSDLSAQQSGNDLVLEIGTDSSLRLNNYFLDPQAWTLQDAQGNTTTAQTLLTATATAQSNMLAYLENQFVTGLKAGYVQNLVNDGYVQQADGSWYLSPILNAAWQSLDGGGFVPVPSSVTSFVSFVGNGSSFTDLLQHNNDVYAHYIVDNSISSLNPSSLISAVFWENTNTNVFDASTSIQQTITNATNPIIYANNHASYYGGVPSFNPDGTNGPYLNNIEGISYYGGNNAGINTSITPSSVWVKVNWGAVGAPVSTRITHESFIYSASPYMFGGHLVFPPLQQIIDLTRSYDVTGSINENLSQSILSSPGNLTDSGSFPQLVQATMLHSVTTDTIEQINVGSGNHTVYGAQNSLVSSGTGDNVIYGAGFVDGGTGNDTMIGGGTLVGGSGNDTMIGGNTMITGTGNDQMFANQTASSFIINAGNTGVDVIGGYSNYSDAVLNAFYVSQGIPNWEEGYCYPNQYSYVQSYGKFSGITYVDTLDATNVAAGWGLSLQQALSDGLMNYIAPLPMVAIVPSSSSTPDPYYATSNTPQVTLSANDFQALAPYYAQGVIPTNHVQLGAGITLANMTFSWGVMVGAISGQPTDPQLRYTTLNISSGSNNPTLNIMIPHSNDPIGSGVTEFDFADGTKIGIAQLIAMAPPAPTFDPQILSYQLGMGVQTLGAGYTSI